MNAMTKLAGLSLCLMLAGLAPAHAGHDHDGDRDRGARMAEELGLDAAKAEQVRTILREQGEKRHALWKESGDKAAAMEKMRALHEETKTRLATVLNAEQLARMEEHFKDRHGRHDRDPAAYIEKELQLTPEQAGSVKEIFADTHEQRKALWDGDLDKAQKYTRMKELHAQTRAKLATVLNEEQLARLDEMHERHMKRKEGRKHRGHGDKDAGDAAPGASPAAEATPTP